MNSETNNWFTSGDFYADPGEYLIKFKDFSPRDVDTSTDFLSVFGCREIELASVCIVKFLTDSNLWNMLLTNNLPGVDNDIFTLMCACGWIKPAWFPTKYHYRVSEEFIRRLYDKQLNKSDDQTF